jgi:hypothetical protein
MKRNRSLSIDHVRRYTSAGFAFVILGGFAVWLAGCSAAQTQKAVADGQLFCAKATATGPLVVALADASGAPVIVTGLASSVVAADCAIIAGIPVTPPANPAAVPVVAAAVAPPAAS